MKKTDIKGNVINQETDPTLNEQPTNENVANQEESFDVDETELSKADEQNSTDEQLLKTVQLEERYARLHADFDNYKKRTQKERISVIQKANKDLTLAILPVIDNLERALLNSENPEDPFVKGVDIVYNQLLDELSKHGLKPIDALNKPFDPKFHDAVAKIPSELDTNIVIEEYQKGYLLNDEVIRPSMVVVSE